MQDANLTGRQQIDSLQALRALAFLGIFFSHARFFISWSSLGVSVFYVMSGFLMAYRYEGVELSAAPGNCFRFSLNRIKKLYPLHIMTMCCAIVPSMASILSEGIGLKPLSELLFNIFLNITLLQTWIPNSTINVSLNGVAWYLSVALFLYFLFPWLKRIIERRSLVSLCITSGIILLAEIIACIPFIALAGYDSPVYTWFMYCFPVFRVGDFFIGCVLKRVFFELNLKNIRPARATTYEVLATAMTVFVFMWLKQKQSSIVLLALHNRTTIYIPIAAVWVVLFAANKGCLTRLLSNRLTIYIGNISAYAFLIHYVITRYTSHILSLLNIAVDGWSKAFLVFAELALTILLSALYKKVVHRKHTAES